VQDSTGTLLTLAYDATVDVAVQVVALCGATGNYFSLILLVVDLPNFL
jgi:hypothetical protein